MKKKRKIKIKYKNVFLFLCFLVILFFFFNYLFHLKITNVYINNTMFLKDRYVLEKADLFEKTTIVESFFMKITDNLEMDVYIKKAVMTRKNISEIHLEIEENMPIFYNDSTKKTVLEDGKEVEEVFDVPKLLNYVPDTKYKKLITKLSELERNSLMKISEIKYEPNDKDENRFLLSMVDGNYVYITLNKLDTMNSYVDIMLEIQTKFDQKKGILYLDSGQYFQVLEN